MSTQPATTVAPVRAQVVVETSRERAFEAFTAGMQEWWPEDKHLLDGVVSMTFEPHVGGAIIDRSADGRESRWAHVLAYEPPERVVFSWDISLQWQIETDPERASEVEVRFIAETPQRTRVELEHRKLDRHGEGWEQMSAAVDGGWQSGLEAFAQHLRS